MRDEIEIRFMMEKLLARASKNNNVLEIGKSDEQWVKLIHQRELLGKVDALQWVLQMRMKLE